MDQNVYQQFAELEKNHWWFRGRRTVYGGLLKDYLQDQAPGRVLDLGCGLGGFLPTLSQVGFEVHGADMDPESLKYCHSRGFSRCAEVDCYRLPYSDNCFDWITMFDVVEHIEDDSRLLQEVARVLKPGGKVMISVPAYQFLYANNDRVARHYRRYTLGKVRNLFEATGYQVDRNTHSNVFLSPIIIPAVLFLKLLETTLLSRKASDHTNLSLNIPPFLNTLLYRIFAAELPFSRRLNLPLGHSIAAIATLR